MKNPRYYRGFSLIIFPACIIICIIKPVRYSGRVAASRRRNWQRRKRIGASSKRGQKGQTLLYIVFLICCSFCPWGLCLLRKNRANPRSVSLCFGGQTRNQGIRKPRSCPERGREIYLCGNTSEANAVAFSSA